MWEVLTSLTFILSVLCYGYVGVLFGLARSRAGANWVEAAVYGATWPVTAYNTIKALEHKVPR